MNGLMKAMQGFVFLVSVVRFGCEVGCWVVIFESGGLLSVSF